MGAVRAGTGRTKALSARASLPRPRNAAIEGRRRVASALCDSRLAFIVWLMGGNWGPAMRLRVLLSAAALAATVLSTPVFADSSVYSDLSGSEIVALLDAHGYSATLTTDDHGDPLIMGSVDGLKFRVFTYNCNAQAPRRCNSLQFVSSFALGHKPTPDDYVAMNKYNNDRIFGRAFINDDNDAAIDYVINLTGGVMAGNLMDDVSTWKTYVLDKFVAQLGWKSS